MLTLVAEPAASGNRAGHAEAAPARHLQTLARYEQVIHTAFRDVSDALVGHRKSREQRVQQELRVEALADSAALAITRFVGGIDSYLQVLDAERQLLDAELELTRVQASALLNLVQLYKALGGGWQPDGAAVATAPMVSTASQRGSRSTSSGCRYQATAVSEVAAEATGRCPVRQQYVASFPWTNVLWSEP